MRTCGQVMDKSWTTKNTLPTTWPQLDHTLTTITEEGKRLRYALLSSFFYNFLPPENLKIWLLRSVINWHTTYRERRGKLTIEVLCGFARCGCDKIRTMCDKRRTIIDKKRLNFADLWQKTLDICLSLYYHLSYIVLKNMHFLSWFLQVKVLILS